jgi:riboflavin-specific deaminase-like protein
MGITAGNPHQNSTSLAPTGRPFVFMNTAMTADGKIAPENRNYIPFGSERDFETLLKLRTRADAVMAGARTVDQFPVNMGPGGMRFQQMRKRLGKAEYNLRVIVSGKATLQPTAEIFKHTFSPILLITSEAAPEEKRRELGKVCTDQFVSPGTEISFKAALNWLQEKWGVRDLLCEGGGVLNDALFREGLVDEVYLTICPLIFGGKTAPTMVDGEGVATLEEATQLKLVGKRLIDGEMFLRYRVIRDKKPAI